MLHHGIHIHHMEVIFTLWNDNYVVSKNIICIALQVTEAQKEGPMNQIRIDLIQMYQILMAIIEMALLLTKGILIIKVIQMKLH